MEITHPGRHHPHRAVEALTHVFYRHIVRHTRTSSGCVAAAVEPAEPQLFTFNCELAILLYVIKEAEMLLSTGVAFGVARVQDHFCVDGSMSGGGGYRSAGGARLVFGIVSKVRSASHLFAGMFLTPGRF